MRETFDGIQLDLAAHPWTYRRESWSVDRMHPSEVGHRRLANSFARELADEGWPVVAMPSLDTGGGAPPSTMADLVWVVTKGIPWVGRRARDLVPWATTLLAKEGAAAAARRARRWRQIAFPA